MRTAVISGSFDPFTLGHLDLVNRASRIFDKVVILICKNSEKDGMFSIETRKKAISACVLPENTEIDVLEGLLAEYCKKYRNPVIVRGARNGSDFEYESQVCSMNREIGNIDTLVFPCDGRLAHISSTYAREMLRYGHGIEGIVPNEAIEILTGQASVRK